MEALAPQFCSLWTWSTMRETNKCYSFLSISDKTYGRKQMGESDNRLWEDLPKPHHRPNYNSRSSDKCPDISVSCPSACYIEQTKWPNTSGGLVKLGQQRSAKCRKPHSKSGSTSMRGNTKHCLGFVASSSVISITWPRFVVRCVDDTKTDSSLSKTLLGCGLLAPSTRRWVIC